MKDFFNIACLIVIAGIVMPFLWQAIKKLTGVQDKLALFCSLALYVILAVVVLWFSSSFSWIAVPFVAFLIFLVAQFMYEKVIVKFFPGKGSL